MPVKCGFKNIGDGKRCKSSVYRDGMCFVHYTKHNTIVNNNASSSIEIQSELINDIDIDNDNIEMKYDTIYTNPSSIHHQDIPSNINSNIHNNIGTDIRTDIYTDVIEDSRENYTTFLDKRIHTMEQKLDQLTNSIQLLSLQNSDVKKNKKITKKILEQKAISEHYKFCSANIELLKIIDLYYKGIGIEKYNKHFIRAYINNMYIKLNQNEKDKWITIAYENLKK